MNQAKSLAASLLFCFGRFLPVLVVCEQQAGAAESGNGPQETATTQPHITPCDAAVRRRIVFTNWYLINPGWFTWDDRQGNPVGISENKDPRELTFRPNNRPYGIRLMAQQARRVSVEYAFSTILYDGEKKTYSAWSEVPEGFGYFESTDGYKWKRLDLRPRIARGNKTIFLDPSAPSTERYKMVIEDDPGGASGAASPDGINWTKFPEKILKDDSDTINVAYYDTTLKKYVLYHRKYRQPGSGEFSNRWRRRGVGRSESEDFRYFPPSELVVESTRPELPPNVDIYTNSRTTIPHAPDLHLMFPAVYHRDTDTTSIWMASSCDGKRWDFLPGSPILTTADFGLPDGGCLFASINLVELPDASYVLPYFGYNVPHKYPRGQSKRSAGYIVWPKGRIVALEAEEKGGFTMIPIRAAGSRLRINALTARAGSIRVELVQNVENDLLTEPPAVPGRSFADCDPIIGDHYATLVTWNGQADLGSPKDAPLTLRFKLDRARLFSLELVK